jgi:hypothetical protein
MMIIESKLIPLSLASFSKNYEKMKFLICTYTDPDLFKFISTQYCKICLVIYKFEFKKLERLSLKTYLP